MSWRVTPDSGPDGGGGWAGVVSVVRSSSDDEGRLAAVDPAPV